VVFVDKEPSICKYGCKNSIAYKLRRRKRNKRLLEVHVSL
jgi:hypothetical protein